MFRHVEDLNSPSRPFRKDPLWQQTKAIFDSFPELASKKDPRTFTSKFLEAQSLQLMHILLKGRKHFDLFSPAETQKMYTKGSDPYVHFNGLINYSESG